MKRLILTLIFMFTCSFSYAIDMRYEKSKLPYEKKLQIYKYYSQAEDQYGLDSAFKKTSKRFKISEKEVVKIKTEGSMEDWLGEFTAPPSNKSPQQIQKEKDEFGAELYKAAKKIQDGK